MSSDKANDCLNKRWRGGGTAVCVQSTQRTESGFMLLVWHEGAKLCHCIYCTVRAEKAVAEGIERLLHIRTVHLCYDREERRNGQWTIRTLPLYGEYLFAYSAEPVDVRNLYGIDRVRRVLRYGDGECNLYGGDRAFALWALARDGHIGISQAMKAGDKARITGGPLRDYEGTIIRYDRHRRRALVDVTGSGNIEPVWMYFEWLVETDSGLVRVLDMQ